MDASSGCSSASRLRRFAHGVVVTTAADEIGGRAPDLVR
jgi:monoamine oxidase